MYIYIGLHTMKTCMLYIYIYTYCTHPNTQHCCDQRYVTCTTSCFRASPQHSAQLSCRSWGSKVYNEQVNDEPGNYGAGFLGLRRALFADGEWWGWAGDSPLLKKTRPWWSVSLFLRLMFEEIRLFFWVQTSLTMIYDALKVGRTLFHHRELSNGHSHTDRTCSKSTHSSRCA